jgi:predicted nuclease of predicted toxin-antitoxin system
MKFIVDAMLPDELVLRLREKGAEARHVRFLKQTGLNDQRVWEYACQNGDTLISKDHDFLSLSLQDRRAKLVHVTIGNVSRAEIVDLIMARYDEILSFNASNDPVLSI